MAYDANKAKAMRGDPEPDPEDPNEGAEGESEGEPTPAELAAARRAIAAVKAGDARAFCAAIKDIDDDDYKPET